MQLKGVVISGTVAAAVLGSLALTASVADAAPAPSRPIGVVSAPAAAPARVVASGQLVRLHAHAAPAKARHHVHGKRVSSTVKSNLRALPVRVVRSAPAQLRAVPAAAPQVVRAHR